MLLLGAVCANLSSAPRIEERVGTVDLSLPFRRSRNSFKSTVNASRPRSGSAVKYTASGRKRQAGVPSDLLFRRTLCDDMFANERCSIRGIPTPTAALPA